MTVSLLEVLAAARAHAAPLAAESAGYLLLAVADHVVAAPRAVVAADVELTGEGAVRLRARRGTAPDEGVEQAVRRLLGQALEVASSVGPALRRAAQRREPAGLELLVRELETALIPVNRSAARRALSRLHRETERARAAGKLDHLLGDEPAAVVAPAPAAVAVVPVAVAPVAVAPVAVVPIAVAPVAVAGVSPVVALPEPQPVVEAVAAFADFPDPSPLAPALPAVVASPPVAPAKAAPAPPFAFAEVDVVLSLSPPLPAEEPAFTKPEPVVERARVRAGSTPKLGTLVTAQTLPGEEADRTERAPDVALEDEADELDLPIEVELEDSPAPPAAPAEAAQPLENPEPSPLENPEPSPLEDPELSLMEDPELSLMEDPEPSLMEGSEPSLMEDSEPSLMEDPEPSLMPDVLTAMLELHTGIDADEAPTRLREVVTELRPPALTPEPEQVEDAWLTHSSLEGIVSAAEPSIAAPSIAEPPSAPEASVVEAGAPEASVAEPVNVVEASFWAPSAPVVFEPEIVSASVHEALTWDPGAVEPVAVLPQSLLIAEPAPEPSPYSPAVLPARTSDVSELLDTFYVSSAAEERDLRGALKEIAGLELTPMPHPLISER